MCQRDRAGCPRLRRHSAGRGCRSVAGAATRQSRSLPQAGAATRQSRSSRRRPPAGGATASTRARSAPHCARLSTRRRYATRRPQPARGRLSLPRSAIRRRSAARGSSKNRRSPPHHWSRAPFGERLRRVQLASARVGDRRGGRYDRRRRDHRRADRLHLPVSRDSATCWPREESLLRQVPTWQIQTRVRTDTHMRHARKTARN